MPAVKNERGRRAVTVRGDGFSAFFGGRNDLEKLAGYVEHIIYRNADNGYTVLNLVSGEEEITCVGIFSAIAEGENIEASGDYTDHPTYGKQFKVESFDEKAPEDEEAIERYLGSGRSVGLVWRWQRGLCADSRRIPFGLSRRSRSGWRK